MRGPPALVFRTAATVTGVSAPRLLDLGEEVAQVAADRQLRDPQPDQDTDHGTLSPLT